MPVSINFASLPLDFFLKLLFFGYEKDIICSRFDISILANWMWQQE
jgi:hypothetical protein